MSQDTSTTYSALSENVSRNILLCVLDENLDKLAILKHMNGWSEHEQTVIEYKTIEELCKVIKTDDLLPAELKKNIDLSDFLRDCSFIESTIRKTFKEVHAKGTYDNLVEIVNIFKKLESDECYLLQNTKEKELEYTGLQEMFCKEREIFQKEINDVMTKIGKIKDEIEFLSGLQKMSQDTSTTYSALSENVSRNILLCVLDENLDKLAILKNMNGWSEHEQTVIEYKTIEELCKVIKTDDLLPAELKKNIDLSDFLRDCSFIESTIRKTFKEVHAKGTYDNLVEIVNIFKKLESDECYLLQNTKEKELEYTGLQEMFCKEREIFQKEINDVMTKIGKIKDEIEDFEEESEIKSKYLTNWENAKIEISQYVLDKKEKEIKEKISERQHDFTKEDRVHYETIDIFKEIYMDFQKDIRKWQLKYENDLYAMNAKINNLQAKKDQQQQRTTDMVKLYIKRQQQIDAYKEHLVEQEKKRMEKERKDKAATTIQAWWRGTMVRKGFGKYKKKKDKKGKKKPAGKK